MDRKEARKVRLGDRLIVGRFPEMDPLKVVKIEYTHKDFKCKTPVFLLEGAKNLLSYRVLERPIEKSNVEG